MRKTVLLILSVLLGTGLLPAQSPTRVRGNVFDDETGEPLPYVSIIFLGTRIGTMSDEQGAFSLESLQKQSTVSFQMLGYETQNIPVTAGRTTDGLQVRLKPDTYGLQSAVVTPKKGKDARYRRRNNPAVELALNVIAHKEANHVRSLDHYKSADYDKLILSLDDFNVDFDSSRFWRRFPFFEKYVDTAQFKNSPVLTVSLREQQEETYWHRQPPKTRTYVVRRRLLGFAEYLDKGGIGVNIEAIFANSDIFDENVDVMLNRFVSPINSSLATTFYKYYITDTLVVDGTRCIDLTFVPANNRSFGFTGHLYVVADSTYAIKRYTLGIPARINLNYVSELAIEENFARMPSGVWASTEKNTYARFYIFKWMQQLYAHRKLVHHEYEFSEAASAMPDTLENHPDRLVYNPDWWRPDEYWYGVRPVPLSPKERVLDSLKVEIRREPRLSDAIDAVETLSTEFMPTARNRSASRWDYGPLSSVIHYNPVEGLRLRVGGMTTANLNPKNFLNGYVAYGFGDKRFKYGLTYIHSFTPKDYHPFEPLRNNFSLSYRYDLEAPGQSFSLMDRDHFMMSTITPAPLQYVQRVQMRYEREWISRLSFDTQLRWDRVEPAGTLAYLRYDAAGALEPVQRYDDLSWTARLRFAPGEPLYSNRLGKESPLTLTKDAPILSLTHTFGRFDRTFTYNRTDFSIQKRLWLSAFGHIDASLQAGIVWNRVPLPKLYSPNANLSFLLQNDAFNLMSPMEFVMDRYAEFAATYYLKGWILNRIPLINRLGLREVVSFRAVAGSLSDKNNPLVDGTGLYAFPEGTHQLGKAPYMEYTVGLENIFNILRVDYVRRINYLDWVPDDMKQGFKVSIHITM